MFWAIVWLFGYLYLILELPAQQFQPMVDFFGTFYPFTLVPLPDLPLANLDSEADRIPRYSGAA